MRSIDNIKKNRKDRLGRWQGYWEIYRKNGILYYKGSYKNDEKDGIWEYYNKDGSLKCKGLFNNGNLIKWL